MIYKVCLSIELFRIYAWHCDICAEPRRIRIPKNVERLPSPPKCRRSHVRFVFYVPANNATCWVVFPLMIT